MKPRLLDLFCGAGGAAVGYARAGFEVVGVDNRPQADAAPESEGRVIPFVQDTDFTLYVGDALAVLRELPDESVDCAATSPPFFGLRDYQVEGQIGLEATPEEWCARLVDVFHELRRVLVKTGTLWIEIGTSYDNKNLVDQPAILADGLKADGWIHRSKNVWHKLNCLPESATDRPTVAHSYVLQFAKSRSYFHNAEAVREPAEWARWGDQTPGKAGWIQPKSKQKLQQDACAHPNRGPDPLGFDVCPDCLAVFHVECEPKYLTQGRTTNGPRSTERRHETPGFEQRLVSADGQRNLRSVWSIPTEPTSFGLCTVCRTYWDANAPSEHCGTKTVAHFATWPHKLVARILAMACPTGGTVLDPFIGSAVTARQAHRNGGRCIGIELNPDYAEIAWHRTRQLSLLAKGTA